MTRRERKITHCPVPGHGTRCEPSIEKARFYPRHTEEQKALEYEAEADAEG